MADSKLNFPFKAMDASVAFISICLKKITYVNQETTSYSRVNITDQRKWESVPPVVFFASGVIIGVKMVKSAKTSYRHSLVSCKSQVGFAVRNVWPRDLCQLSIKRNGRQCWFWNEFLKAFFSHCYLLSIFHLITPLRK